MFIHFLELFPVKTIAIRVSDEDHKLFSDLAARELMPLSVLVRRLVHAHAVSLALIPDPIAEAKRALQPTPAAPTPAPTPAPAAPQRTPAPTPAAQPMPNPFAHLPPVDDVMFEYPEPVDNPPPDDLA